MKSLRQVWAAAQYFQNPFFKLPRSEEGSLRDKVPQAGLGGSPIPPLKCDMQS